MFGLDVHYLLEQFRIFIFLGSKGNLQIALSCLFVRKHAVNVVYFILQILQLVLSLLIFASEGIHLFVQIFYMRFPFPQQLVSIFDLILDPQQLCINLTDALLQIVVGQDGLQHLIPHRLQISLQIRTFPALLLQAEL